MAKKIINLDKEYQCSTDNYEGLSIETGKYIIEVKGKQLLDIIGTSCKKLLSGKKHKGVKPNPSHK